MSSSGSWAAGGPARWAPTGAHLPAAAPDAGGPDPLWAGWKPGWLDAAAAPGDGDAMFTCSVHLKSRTRRNLVEDGHGGLRCTDKHSCLVGGAHTPAPAPHSTALSAAPQPAAPAVPHPSPRPAPQVASPPCAATSTATGTATAATAPRPPSTTPSDDQISGDLAVAEACLFYSSPANLATRDALLARLAAGGVEVDVAGSTGWWRAPGGRWGKHPSTEEVLSAVPLIDLVFGDGATAAAAPPPEESPAAAHAGTASSAGASGLVGPPAGPGGPAPPADGSASSPAATRAGLIADLFHAVAGPDMAIASGGLEPGLVSTIIF